MYCSSIGKESACKAGDLGSIPRSGRAPGEGIGYPLQYSWASLVVQPVKNPPVMWETWVQSLGWEDPLEKGKAIHSSILAWRIPWGCKESDTTERLSLHYSKSNVKPVGPTVQAAEYWVLPSGSGSCPQERPGPLLPLTSSFLYLSPFSLSTFSSQLPAAHHKHSL